MRINRTNRNEQKNFNSGEVSNSHFNMNEAAAKTIGANLDQSEGKKLKARISPNAALEINQFVTKFQIKKSDIWQLIRHGELAARIAEGQVYVFGDLPQDYPVIFSNESLEIESNLSAANQSPIYQNLDPQIKISEKIRSFFPTNDHDPEITGPESLSAEIEPKNLASSSDRGSEISLLLDHLSLAKEENLEILRLTQSAIERVTRMSEQVLSLKEDALALEKERNKLLQMKLDEQFALTQKLKQEKEDLEMLADSLTRE
ncbi:MAG: hypothetical protein KBD78_00125 [Oligoflexales bacterium]|nr:hypothetical protein [Oligoflexales bacterium]